MYSFLKIAVDYMRWRFLSANKYLIGDEYMALNVKLQTHVLLSFQLSQRTVNTAHVRTRKSHSCQQKQLPASLYEKKQFGHFQKEFWKEKISEWSNF